jgi:sucrose-6-phosphate hydrolase SacC (GH32 family)
LRTEVGQTLSSVNPACLGGACFSLPTAALLLLCGCGRYADFALPAVTGGDPKTTFAFEERPAPVMERGSANDLLNPSVFRAGSGFTNYYSMFDGKTWHTRVAESADGIQWRDTGKVLSPDPATWEGSYIAANGSALFYGGQIWYWYEAGARERLRIGLRGQAVLEPGPWGSWDERGVADPYVIRVEPYFYLYYLGQDRGARQKIGVARSRDGVRWEKLRSNPVLEGDDNVGEPAVWQSHGFYWMLYTAREAGEVRRMRLARSVDGVQWTLLAAKFGGAQAWDAKVVCDPTVVVDGDRVLVWFGGGDVARVDENIHGQIGFGVLRPVSATLEK